MAQTPLKVPYGRVLLSAPLLNALAGKTLSVRAMSATLQALAEIRHRAGPFDELRSKIIKANQEKNEDGTLSCENGDPNRPMVSLKGINKLIELEKQELDLYCRQASCDDFDGVKLTAQDMVILGWFITGADLPAGEGVPPPAAPVEPADEPAAEPAKVETPEAPSSEVPA